MSLAELLSFSVWISLWPFLLKLVLSAGGGVGSFNRLFLSEPFVPVVLMVFEIGLYLKVSSGWNVDFLKFFRRCSVFACVLVEECDCAV